MSGGKKSWDARYLATCPIPREQMTDGKKKFPEGEGTYLCRTSLSRFRWPLSANVSIFSAGGRQGPQRGKKNKTPQDLGVPCPSCCSAVCPGASHTTSSCVNVGIHIAYFTLCGDSEKEKSPKCSAVVALEKCLEMVATVLHYYHYYC